jgi:putative transposase
VLLDDHEIHLCTAGRYGFTRSDEAIVNERCHFGYRRIHIMLKRECIIVYHKKLFRLYRDEKLFVRKRRGRKRTLGMRAPMLAPLLSNQRWSLDFVSDQFTYGRRLRVLSVIDNCTRECIALVADTSLWGCCMAREFHQIIAQRRSPKIMVKDKGTEFTSNANLKWADEAKVELHYIAPVKPNIMVLLKASMASSEMKGSTTPIQLIASNPR